jgi:tetratricopeptide (TPR) repeat protein
MKLQQSNLGLGATTNLGLCLMNSGRHAEASDCFRRNINLLGKTYFNMGLTLFRMKSFEKALENFQKALDITPDDPEYLDLAGQTYAELGKYKIAEKYLRRSVKKDPQYALAYYDLGILLAKFKARQMQAMRCFMTAIKLDSNLSWAYYSIACLHALSGNKERAYYYLERSLEKGLSDKKHIESDPDMDSLRKDKEFGRLMIRYFPGKSN